jgi:hypothetical protein
MRLRNTLYLIQAGICGLGLLFAPRIVHTQPITPGASASAAAPSGSGSAAPSGSGSAAPPASDSASAPLPPAPKPPAPPSALQLRLRAASTRATELTQRVRTLEGRHTITEAQTAGYLEQISSWVTMLKSLNDLALRIEQAKAEDAVKNKATTDAWEPELNKQAATVESGLGAIETQLDDAEKATGWNLVGTLLRARCGTAICFDNGNRKDWLGIEPLVELPVGKSFALSRSSLSNYVDNHDLRVDLAAGVRVWMFRDVVSFSLYISKPLTDGRIRLEGSPFVYPAASIRRPYPGFAVGLFFDSIWIGFDRDELRNGDGQDSTALNSAFPPNTVVSSSWTLTLALQPVTAFRTAIGTAVQSTKESK